MSKKIKTKDPLLDLVDEQGQTERIEAVEEPFVAWAVMELDGRYQAVRLEFPFPPKDMDVYPLRDGGPYESVAYEHLADVVMEGYAHLSARRGVA